MNDSQATVTRVRSSFPIFREKVYLNSCSQGALSNRVELAFVDYLQSWHQYGSPWDIWVEHYENARKVFASFINADPDEVAIVASASAGVNSVASALCFKERPKVVLGEFEFPTMGHIWLAQQARGANIEFVNATEDSIPLSAYKAKIDRQTLIVPLTHVCFMNGFRSPVADVVRMAHDHGALVLLDDYQDCGTRPVDVKAMDLDFYVSGTLKYLLGPPGMAFLYARRSIVPSLTPTVTGWFGQANPFAFDVRHFDPAPAARRFESGTPPIPSIYGSCEGVLLLQEVGLQVVESHVKNLVRTLLDGARDLKIRTKTPPGSRGPLVVLQAKAAEALVSRFAENGVIVSSRRDGLRISFHIYNTLDDVEYVLQLLQRNLDLLVTEEGNPAVKG